MAVLDLKRKLAILSDAAKYDASCASSGAEKRNSLSGPGGRGKGVGSTEGKSMPIAKLRAAAIALDGGTQLVVSWHPSYLLRVPDPDARARAYADLVADLKLARDLAA